MNVLHLEVFTRLVEQRNFSRVAKDLGISQPTVTLRIKALEEELGVPLIHRLGNKVSITPAGYVFFEYVERSMRVLKDGFDNISNQAPKLKRRFPVATSPTNSAYFIPPILGQFIVSRPDADVVLHIGSTREVVEMTLDEVALVGFIGGFLDHPELISLPVCQYPFTLVAAPDHPLSARTVMDVFDLKDQSLILSEQDAHSSYMIKNLFREFCERINPAMELNDSEAVKRMVIAGNGIAFLPRIVAARELQEGTLVALPLQLPRPLLREISLIFRRIKKDDPLLTDFLQHLFSSVEAET